MNVPKTRVSSWIAYPRPKARPEFRVVCFPYAGGGVAAFRNWPEHLPEEVELAVLQFPGRESRILEPAFTRMTDLVRVVTDALFPLLDIPFVFFGHSMGAYVCFETARELRKRDLPGPRELILSGARPPNVSDPDPDIRHLPDEEFVAEIGRRYDGIPAEVLEHRELLELVLPGLRADIELMETHVYVEEAPLNCPILCVGGQGDRRANVDELHRWQEQTVKEFTLRMFEGGHFFLQTEEAALLEVINRELGKIVTRGQ